MEFTEMEKERAYKCVDIELALEELRDMFCIDKQEMSSLILQVLVIKYMEGDDFDEENQGH